MKTFILAIAVLVGGTAMAQQPEKREHKTPEQRATGMTEKMTTKLSLDDAQKTKIQNINLGIAKKNDEIRQNTSLTREQKFAQIKENHDSRKAQYKEVLSTDQYAKYEAWEKEKQEKMQAKRAERQESPKGGKGGKGSKGSKQAPPTQETDEEL